MNYGYGYDNNYGAGVGTAAAGIGVGAVILGIFYVLYYIILIAYVVLGIIGLWKTFVKMGRKGYEGIISGYNDVVLFQAVKMPIWYYFLLLIPVYGLIIKIKRGIELAKKFGKSTAFGVVALGIFDAVGYFILGISKDVKYKD